MNSYSLYGHKQHSEFQESPLMHSFQTYIIVCDYQKITTDCDYQRMNLIHFGMNGNYFMSFTVKYLYKDKGMISFKSTL